MTDDFTLDPARTYKPKQPVVVVKTEEFDLDYLEDMTKEALISLVQRMSRQCGMVACKTEEELRVAFLDRMAHIALTAKALEALAAMEKRMNRTEGTPIQRQQSMVAIGTINDDSETSQLPATDLWIKNIIGS